MKSFFVRLLVGDDNKEQKKSKEKTKALERKLIEQEERVVNEVEKICEKNKCGN